MVENQGLDEENLDIETRQHEAEGSLLAGWPAILLTVAMLASAVYAFAPRPFPPFSPTQLKASEMMANGLAHQGSRYIAVGELGMIKYAEDANGPWRDAKVEPQRGATLTKVKFVGDDVALAVGHSGWLLRSEDGGKTWSELRYNEQSADPLLGVSGPFKGKASGKLFVYGAFGQYLVSTDGGRNWRAETLSVQEDGTAQNSDAGTDLSAIFGDESEGTASETDSEDYDPFASFEAGNVMTDYSTQHIYDIAEAADGSLFLAGERGMLLRSTDGGKTWQAFEDIYSGSFYGLLAVGESGMLVYGMRGHAYLTDDMGQTWAPSNIPVVQGLYSADMSGQGSILMVGASNTVLVSHDQGKSFKQVSRRGPDALASVMYLGDGRWLMAGEGGVGRESALKAADE